MESNVTWCWLPEYFIQGCWIFNLMRGAQRLGFGRDKAKEEEEAKEGMKVRELNCFQNAYRERMAKQTIKYVKG